MTVPEHTHTTQEQTIWDHMEAGEWDQIGALHDTATIPPYTPPDPAPADWEPGPDQWNRDYANATAHYQDAHEASEEERAANTADHVEAEND